MNFSPPSFPSLLQLHCDLCCCCVYVNILIDSSIGAFSEYCENTAEIRWQLYLLLVVLWIMMTSGGCWSPLWSPFVNNHGSHLSPPAHLCRAPLVIHNYRYSPVREGGWWRRTLLPANLWWISRAEMSQLSQHSHSSPLRLSLLPKLHQDFKHLNSKLQKLRKLRKLV